MNALTPTVDFSKNIRNHFFRLNIKTELSWVIPSDPNRRDRAKIIKTIDWEDYKYPLGYYLISPAPNKQEVTSLIKKLDSHLFDDYLKIDFQNDELDEFEHLLRILMVVLREYR